MKKILITQRLTEASEYKEIRNALDIRWLDLLLELDLLPIPLLLNVDLSLYDDIDIRGVILTGGGNLFAQSQDQLSLLRNEHEKKCLDYSLERSIPVIGVCRGMLEIAEYFGSSIKKIKKHVGNRHRITSNINHKYKSLTDRIKNVNSYHNYAIDKLGNGLEPIVHSSEDNVIEAIVHEKHNIYAQMWHPERENPFDKNNGQLISTIFK